MARGNKGQHKIPRTYLEAFTDSQGFVWITDRKYNLYKQKPLHTLTEKDYYTIRFDTGGGTLDVETKFLGGIEATYSKIYKDVLEKRLELSQEDKAKLAIFVASMMERQPMVRESMRKFFADIEEHVKHLRGLPDHVKKKMSEMPNFSSGGPSIPADDLLKVGKDVGSFHSSTIPDTVVGIAPVIFDMKWAFMVKPKNSQPFMTSDNPCVMVDPIGEAEFGRGSMGAAPGLAKKDIELTLPLSSDIALFCSWGLNFDCLYVPVEESLVLDINRRTRRHARNVISSDKKIMETLIERTKAYQESKNKV